MEVSTEHDLPVDSVRLGVVDMHMESQGGDTAAELAQKQVQKAVMKASHEAGKKSKEPLKLSDAHKQG